MKLDFWPFRRSNKVTKTWEEVVQEQPDVPCEDKAKHYLWVFNGCPCFSCVDLAKRQEKERDEDRLAEKIAQAILRTQIGRNDIQFRFGE